MKAIHFLAGNSHSYNLRKLFNCRVGIVLATLSILTACGSSNMTTV